VTQPHPESGSTANSYVILAKLATGGMAEIFLARNASAAGIERYVVLKRVLRHRANDASFVRMFLDEARLAAQLQHPNIAQVYDTGVLGDSYFFTMEYVHGETVRELLHRTYAPKAADSRRLRADHHRERGGRLHHAHERIGIEGRRSGSSTATCRRRTSWSASREPSRSSTSGSRRRLTTRSRRCLERSKARSTTCLQSNAAGD